MATEDYQETDLENIPQRGRTKTMKITDPKSGIATSTKNMPLIRSSSVGPQSQGKEGTCYAYTAARLITRFITQKFPDEFELNDDEAKLLYDEEGAENCVFINSDNLKAVRNILTIDKCSIDKRYNHMLLFYFTLFSIKRRFGCKGNNVETILNFFCDDDGLKMLYYIYSDDYIRDAYDYILSNELDTIVVDRFIRPLIQFRINTETKTKTSVISTKSVYYNLNDNSPQRNWILNFPEPAKRALKNKMYVAFSFAMPENQWVTINKYFIFDSNPVIRDTRCVKPINRHSVVITKWEQEEPDMPAYITIINSWGSEWGNNGFIRISSEHYYKFVMTPFCKTDIEYTGNLLDPENTETIFKLEYLSMKNYPYYGMQFTYLKVADDKPFVTNKTVPAIVPTLEPAIVPELGPEIKSEIVVEPAIVPKPKRSTWDKTKSRVSKLFLSKPVLGGKSKKRKSKTSKKKKSIKRKTRKRY